MARRTEEPPSSEITPIEAYLQRREFIKRAGVFAATSVAWGGSLIALSSQGSADAPAAPADGAAAALEPKSRGRYGTNEKPTSFEDITTYNNFYELGLSKSAPAEYGHLIRTRPWSVRVEGEVGAPMTLDLDTLLRWFPLEERVYRMRCVEAWSMVIPWVGFALGELVRRLNPTSRAKFVEFTTLLAPEQMPGQNVDVLPWPYVEALRIDEASHPLAFIALGLYGKKLLGQNGAPLRLVVPWKYGFKGAKSIVMIRFTSERPATTWNLAAPREYGFYANVNPAVDHPRWSQAEERRIGDFMKRETLPFNGYAEQVASLYSGMDLAVEF
jgi:methionine sulfoxide reductase catalytic subunit